MSEQVAIVAKRRFAVMAGINAVCALVAIGSAVAAFKFGVDVALFALAAALVVGFGAQIWFIVGLRAAAKQGA